LCYLSSFFFCWVSCDVEKERTFVSFGVVNWKEMRHVVVL
jgi:hypothetical protein